MQVLCKSLIHVNTSLCEYERMVLQLSKRYNLESLLVSRLQEYGTGHAYVGGILPSTGTNTPPVPGDEAREVVLRCGGDQVVTPRPSELQKFSGDLAAYSVQ
jgi:hypothetical protein